MRFLPIAAACLLLTACGRGEEQANASNQAMVAAAPAAAGAPSPPPAPPAKNAASRWDLQSSGEGMALVLLEANGSTAMRLFCPARAKTLVVSIPGFRPIASEDRLSFGSGDHVEALVVQAGGDPQGRGVTAGGAVPADLARMLAAPVSASYGAQTGGKHPAPPEELGRAFAAACAPPAPAEAPTAPAVTTAAACHVQGDQRLRVRPIRAVGTEPFWNARVEGRCVTYSHPEDADGTRLWTRYSKDATGEIWSGALAGKPFELRVREAPKCSDGMSDKLYPVAVQLRVNGEVRNGCAERI